jgi:N-acetylglucosaminyldiphosphoundecaprenol N-acetyl-beta-D-mannosaminyltransferase
MLIAERQTAVQSARTHLADALDISVERVTWPRKYSIFGVGVSATSYDEVVSKVIDAAKLRQPAILDFMAVHSLICATSDPRHTRRLNAFDVVAPDGQPVRWALNYFHRTELTDRVYGPELMRRVCAAAAEQGVSIYLYGGHPEVLETLKGRLLALFPALKIAGAESPPFRALTDEEDEQVVQRINQSGSGIVLIGLGAPKQEIFAYDRRERILAVQLCVGAAFDFHAGAKKTAPRWMQGRGLEWVFRLVQEPRRLWKRYLVTNSQYLMLFARDAMFKGRARSG